MGWSNKWALALLLAVGVAAPLAADSATGTADTTRTRISLTGKRPGATADERQLGGLAADQLTRQYGVVQDPSLQSRLDAVGSSLTRYCPGEGDGYRFRILKSDDVNAMTTPDGQVFVTRALMRQFRSDDDLAAVLAHEISHVLLGHTAMLLTEPDEERTVVVGRTRRGRLKKQRVTVVSENKRRWEFQADEKGLELLEAAGYPFRAMERVLEFLAAEETEKQGERRQRPSELESATSTHPSSVNRLESLRQYLAARSARLGSPRRPMDTEIRMSGEAGN